MPQNKIEPSPDAAALHRQLSAHVAALADLEQEIRFAASRDTRRERQYAGPLKAKIDAEYRAAIKMLSELSHDMMERAVAAVSPGSKLHTVIDGWGPPRDNTPDALGLLRCTTFSNSGIQDSRSAVTLYLVERQGQPDIEVRNSCGGLFPSSYADEVDAIECAIKRRPSLVRALENAVDAVRHPARRK